MICPKCGESFSFQLPPGIEAAKLTLGEIAYEHSLGSCRYRVCDDFACRAEKNPVSEIGEARVTRHLRFHTHLGQRFTLLDAEELG